MLPKVRKLGGPQSQPGRPHPQPGRPQYQLGGPQSQFDSLKKNGSLLHARNENPFRSDTVGGLTGHYSD